MAFTARRFQQNQRLDTAADNSPPLRRGDSGEAVEILQLAFMDLGFSMPKSTTKCFVPDGIYGPETEAIVRDFQASNYLKQDGVAGRNTLAQLDTLFALREKLDRARIVADAMATPPLSPWYMT